MPIALTTSRTSFRAALAVLVCFAGLVPVPARGAETPKTRARAVFLDQSARIEAEVGALLQRHADAAGPEVPLLDLQIDLRLVSRWMLLKAADAPQDSPLQAAVALRATTFQSAGQSVLQRLQTSTKALTGSQLDGLSKLHQLTYKLPEIKDVGVIDGVCTAVGTDLILASNLAPAEVNHLPQMRPKPIAEPARVAPAAEPPTLAELANRAKAAQVSPALKRALTALATAAQSAAANPKEPEEAATLRDMLAAAGDLADGLEHSTGLDATGRAKVEQQVIEGLALFTDVRTRSIGKGRLESLGRYRETLARVQRLGLPTPMREKLAPTFVWVQQNPDKGAQVLETVEAYVRQCARADARKEAAGLPASQKKTVDAMLKQLAARRSGFLDDAASLGGATLSAGPARLTAHVETMRQLLDSIEGIERLPRALQTLATYKPKPTGGLEKRAQTAVTELGSPLPSPTREASARFIADAEQIAQLADSLAQPPVGVGPETLKAFTHGRLATVDARKTTLLTGLVSQLASGKDPDRLDIVKLQTLKGMVDSLHEAAEVQAALSKAEVLPRWADWSIGPEQFRALLAPYQEATAGAFDGFADDNITPVTRWPDARKRYGPLIALAREAGQYADACATFPAGLPGDLARLLTPLDNQPFALERGTSLSITIWQRYADTTDPKAADALFEAMLLKLRKDLRLPE
jgi:hypothetical protein